MTEARSERWKRLRPSGCTEAEYARELYAVLLAKLHIWLTDKAHAGKESAMFVGWFENTQLRWVAVNIERAKARTASGKITPSRNGIIDALMGR
jgi:hypothetical protein